MVTRLSGGLTPADGSDPRTFPSIWNDTAETIESQGTAISGAQSDIDALEADSIPTDVTSPVAGDSLVYDGTQWLNGPRSGNAIINGDFGVWQRGTSFDYNDVFYADRFRRAGGAAAATITRELMAAGDVEAIGYGDAEYFLKFDVTTSARFAGLEHNIEDVRKFSGQEVTLSFWAKGTNPGGTSSIRVGLNQNFGSGGSSQNAKYQTLTLTSSWTRYSFTFTLDSVSGKTIGSGSKLVFRIQQIGTSTDPWTLDIWGVQLEAGPVATPFKLAGGGGKAAELALCQRYYQRFTQLSAGRPLAFGTTTTTFARSFYNTPVTLRSSPSVNISGTPEIVLNGSQFTVTDTISPIRIDNGVIVSHESSGMSRDEIAGVIYSNGDYIEFDAEL